MKISWKAGYDFTKKGKHQKANKTPPTFKVFFMILNSKEEKCCKFFYFLKYSGLTIPKFHHNLKIKLKLAFASAFRS